MPDHVVAVIGGLTRRIVAEVDAMPEKGQTLVTEKYDSHSNERGAYTAVTAYRLSHYMPRDGYISDRCILEPDNLHVRLVGAVGEDDLGRTLKGRIGEFGVNVEKVRELPKERTSISFFFLRGDSEDREHTVFYCPGANHAVRPHDFDTGKKLIEECGGSLPNLIVTNSELKRVVVQQIIKSAHVAKVPVLFNMVPTCHLFNEYYKHVTHLVTHKAQAREIFPHKCPLDNEHLDKWESVAQEFLARGVTNVVITFGGQGAYYKNKHEQKGSIIIPNDSSVEIINRVGSGETFVGAYAVECIKQGLTPETKEWDIKTAVSRACWAATMSLEHEGCIHPIRWATGAASEAHDTTKAQQEAQ